LGEWRRLIGESWPDLSFHPALTRIESSRERECAPVSHTRPRRLLVLLVMDYLRRRTGEKVFTVSNGCGEKWDLVFTVQAQTNDLDDFAPLRCLQWAGNL
jgi:hypothetical protein